MKNRFFLTLLPLVLTCGLMGQPLRLMTYNLRLDVASDGENDWPHRRDSGLKNMLF